MLERKTTHDGYTVVVGDIDSVRTLLKKITKRGYELWSQYPKGYKNANHGIYGILFGNEHIVSVLDTDTICLWALKGYLK